MDGLNLNGWVDVGKGQLSGVQCLPTQHLAQPMTSSIVSLPPVLPVHCPLRQPRLPVDANDDARDSYGLHYHHFAGRSNILPVLSRVFVHLTKTHTHCSKNLCSQSCRVVKYILDISKFRAVQGMQDGHEGNVSINLYCV